MVDVERNTRGWSTLSQANLSRASLNIITEQFQRYTRETLDRDSLRNSTLIMKPARQRVTLILARQIWIHYRVVFVFYLRVLLLLLLFLLSMEGTAADRDARRVDTGHTRTVCSGTIADPFFFFV